MTDTGPFSPGFQQRMSSSQAKTLALLPSTPPQALRESTQLMLVESLEWSATNATLRRFSRDTTASPWRQDGPPTTVTLGYNGLGWGRGAHGPPPSDGPRKREGDGRSPAGLFRLGTSFGYAALPEVPVKLPYLPLTSQYLCVDDPASKHYNRILPEEAAPYPDWKSAEHMRREDHLYRLGLVVEHNTEAPVPGEGSCIFVHLWHSPGAPTVGCTSTSDDGLKTLLGWLEASAHPLLLQLPAAELSRIQEAWGLPRGLNALPPPSKS